MPNVRYILRLIGAFVVRFRVLLALGVIFGILVFLLAEFLFPVTGANTQRIGLTGRYTAATLPPEITKKIGSGLTKLSPDGNVEPDLSVSWESPDKGKSWIFKLRKDAAWQDGHKLTSADINYQFSDVTIDRPDATTIIFKLQSPYSAFPSVVSRPTFKRGLLGTGEWQVKKLSLAGGFIDQLIIQDKKSQRIVYKFYASEDRAKLAFEVGAVDELSGLIDPAPLNLWKGVESSSITQTGEFVAVFLNTQDKILAEKNVRQALSYAIDKDRLGRERATGPISRDSWAYNSQVKPYSYDLEKAKSMIASYKKDSKQDLLEINLTAPPLLLKQAELVKSNWEKAGVKVNLTVMSNVPADYQALMAIFDIPEDPDQYSIWHSTQTSTNITHYQNPRIDKLLEDGRSELDLESRKKIYLDFQRFLVEDSPAIFLYYPENFTIVR